MSSITTSKPAVAHVEIGEKEQRWCSIQDDGYLLGGGRVQSEGRHFGRQGKGLQRAGAGVCLDRNCDDMGMSLL